MKKHRLIIITIIILIVLTSCLDYKPITITGINGVEVNNLTLTSVDLKVLVPINNPNDFDFKIKKVNVDIYMGKTKLGKAEDFTDVKILAKSNDVHPFKIKVNFGDILSQSAAIFQSLMKRKGKFKIKGFIKVKAFMISKKIPIEEDDIVKLMRGSLFGQ